MGIIGRTGDIIAANFNDMVDRFEDPERMLKQAVREMEQVVSTNRREVARVMAECKLIAKRMAENEKHVEAWAAHAVAAVQAGDDDLARKAILRRLNFEAHASVLLAQQEQMGAARDSFRAQLDAMQAKLSEARRQLATLVLRKRAAELQVRAAWTKDRIVLCPEVADHLDRLRRRVEIAEAEAEALAELAADANRSISAECGFDRELEAEPDVEAELMKMKRDISAR